MWIASSRCPLTLSNSWLVADRPGGQALLIDSGAPFEPIEAQIAEWRVELTQLLCTHRHPDHVAHNEHFRAAHGCEVCGHRLERPGIGQLDRELEHGQELRLGQLTVEVLHVPGHTAGQLAFLIEGQHLFTGDTLFRGSVGSTTAQGHTSFEDLLSSLFERLLCLPAETAVYPGHMERTTLGFEAEHNPFLRAFRGLDRPPTRRARYRGQPVDVLLLAPDYDGGTKAWVRHLEDGRLDVVPGSRVSFAP